MEVLVGDAQPVGPGHGEAVVGVLGSEALDLDLPEVLKVRPRYLPVCRATLLVAEKVVEPYLEVLLVLEEDAQAVLQGVEGDDQTVLGVPGKRKRREKLVLTHGLLPGKTGRNRKFWCYISRELLLLLFAFPFSNACTQIFYLLSLFLHMLRQSFSMISLVGGLPSLHLVSLSWYSRLAGWSSEAA